MKKIFVILLVFFIGTISISANNVPDLAPNAKSAILMEATTGEIIYEKNVHEKYAPASMTKMMVMLLVIESIEKNALSLDEVITVSQNASGMGGSTILLETNEKMTVEDLLKGVAIGSGNDAAVALAERIGGTEENFVNMMNNRVKELGLTNTNFKNPTGLDEANHYSTAYDMLMIAKELVKHTKILEYSSIYETYLRDNTDRKFWLVNTNKLVRFYNGADGLKTGYTDEAGYCLTGTAKRGEMRFVGVVMGEDTITNRNTEMMSMFDYGFNQYETEKVLSKDSVVAKSKVNKGEATNVEIVPLEEVSLLNKRGNDKRVVTYDIKLNEVKAPIKHGDVVGELSIIENNNVISKIKLTVKEDVKKINIFKLMLRNFNDMVSGSLSL